MNIAGISLNIVGWIAVMLLALAVFYHRVWWHFLVSEKSGATDERRGNRCDGLAGEGF